MSRIRLGVAYLMHRAGADEVTEDAFVRQASLDLHWFSPKQGRRFLEAAKALGYVTGGSKAGTVRATFSPAEVEVPMDFKLEASDIEDLPAGPEDAGVVEQLVEMAAASVGWERERVWAEVRRKEEALFETPVAAMLVAGEAGVDVRPFAARVRAALATRPGAATSSASGSGRRS